MRATLALFDDALTPRLPLAHPSDAALLSVRLFCCLFVRLFVFLIRSDRYTRRCYRKTVVFSSRVRMYRSEYAAIRSPESERVYCLGKPLLQSIMGSVVMKGRHAAKVRLDKTPTPMQQFA